MGKGYAQPRPVPGSSAWQMRRDPWRAGHRGQGSWGPWPSPAAEASMLQPCLGSEAPGGQPDPQDVVTVGVPGGGMRMNGAQDPHLILLQTLSPLEGSGIQGPCEAPNSASWGHPDTAAIPGPSAPGLLKGARSAAQPAASTFPEGPPGQPGGAPAARAPAATALQRGGAGRGGTRL